MMAMGYITINTSRKLSIHFADEFWIFAFMTALLLILTLGSYFYYVRYTGIAGTSRQDGNGKDVMNI